MFSLDGSSHGCSIGARLRVRRRVMAVATVLGIWCFCSASLLAQSTIRVGIVGCDTSHVIAFTKLINAEDATGDLETIQVVAAYPGGSQDIEASYTRVDGFVQQLRAMGIEIADDLAAMKSKCDAYLLESVDGRIHLEQFRQIAEGKPVFIDKPAAGSLQQLLAIRQIATETKTPIFSSSALRFCQQVRDVQTGNSHKELQAVEACSPYKTEAHHPDLFWYGIHGVEAMYAVMGTGCLEVQCVEGEQCIATGKWNNGSVGTFRGIKKPTNNQAYRITAYYEKTVQAEVGFSGYGDLVEQIGHFFVTRQAPVSIDETIEMFAFMEAAQESKDKSGQLVSIASVLVKAKQQLADANK